MGGQVSAREDQRARFEEIYGATRVALLQYLARRTSSPEDAADLLSEVYLVAWRRIERVPCGEEARLWLFGVARKLLANHRRRARSEVALASELASELEVTLVDSGGHDQRAEAVRAALAGLGRSDQELLKLTAWEGLTPAEIARVLGRPVGLVRVRLHRARARLRARLAKPPASIAPGPAALGSGK
jgi:RNA polymerase sigma factor (sigma-70 family)